MSSKYLEESSTLNADALEYIHRAAERGVYEIRGLGAKRKLPTFDDLVFLTASLSRYPLEGYREKCVSKTVLGTRYAKKPVELAIPITIAGMSFGALSARAKEALGRGATEPSLRARDAAQQSPIEDLASAALLVDLLTRHRREWHAMKYVCDAPGGRTWFGLETEGEAAQESQAMRHAVEKFFRKEKEKAAQSYVPGSTVFFEQEIGLKAHLQREMPLFLTLRDEDGNALVTAMLPPGGKHDRMFRPIVVGPDNSDPYPFHGDAIRALADHVGMPLDRDRCYPHRR